MFEPITFPPHPVSIGNNWECQHVCSTLLVYIYKKAAGTRGEKQSSVRPDLKRSFVADKNISSETLKR